MTRLGWLEIVGGLVIVLAAAYDLFKSVVLPRPAINKFILARSLFRGLWVTWRWAATRSSGVARREARLAAFGPIGVLVAFTVWALAFVLGYGLMIDGLRTQLHPAPADFGTSLYFSATTLVPLSYGDIVPLGVAARLVTIAESVTGVGLAALVITLLFSLYESFQDREALVIALDALAGAPPSGVQILETAAELRMRDQLAKTFDDWRGWAAAVLESHLAYPILVYFRSSHDNEAWLNSFGAVMDAATLIMSTIQDESDGPARLMFTVGNHLVEDLAWYFGLESSPDPYVEREEFDEAVARMAKAATSAGRPGSHGKSSPPCARSTPFPSTRWPRPWPSSRRNGWVTAPTSRTSARGERDDAAGYASDALPPNLPNKGGGRSYCGSALVTMPVRRS